MNEKTVQWIDKKDWIYQTTFSINPIVWKRQNHELYFEGLDTYANVYLNDSSVLHEINIKGDDSALFNDYSDQINDWNTTLVDQGYKSS